MTQIDDIRRFNRFYTQKMGLLARQYLNTGHSLTDVRVLFELARDAPVTAREIAARLDLDEGHLSRVIAGFAGKGLISRARGDADGRVRYLELTDPGRTFVADLEARSRADIADRLNGVPTGRVAAATVAMGRIERLLAPVDAAAVALRDIAIGDAGWLIQQHGALYARDEGFDASFEPLVAEILADFLRKRDPATERAFIATHGPDRLGSILCVQAGTPGVAKLRLFLLVPEARGMGLGQRLLDACLGFARQAGYRRMVLWTHESHRAACALYQKNGFALTSAKPVRAFGVDLVEQAWEIDL